MSKNMEKAAESLINNIVETVTDTIQHPTSKTEELNRTSARVKRLFGRQKTIHRIFGGGQCMPHCIHNPSVNFQGYISLPRQE